MTRLERINEDLRTRIQALHDMIVAMSPVFADTGALYDASMAVWGEIKALDSYVKETEQKP